MSTKQICSFYLLFVSRQKVKKEKPTGDKALILKYLILKLKDGNNL